MHHYHRLFAIACAAFLTTMVGCASTVPPLPDVVVHYAAAESTATKPALREEEAFWRDITTTIRMEVAAVAHSANEDETKLLFLGDSITQGWRRRSQLWQQWFGIYHPLNGGVVGDATQHVLGRLQRGDFDLLNPQVVALMVGVNNGLNTPEQTAAGVAAILTQVRQRWPEAHIVLHAILPGRLEPEAKLRKRVAATNAILANFADGQGVHWLDLTSRFVQPDGHLHTQMYAKDHLHIQEPGYAAWAEALAPILQLIME